MILKMCSGFLKATHLIKYVDVTAICVEYPSACNFHKLPQPQKNNYSVIIINQTNRCHKNSMNFIK